MRQQVGKRVRRKTFDKPFFKKLNWKNGRQMVNWGCSKAFLSSFLDEIFKYVYMLVNKANEMVHNKDERKEEKSIISDIREGMALTLGLRWKALLPMNKKGSI